MATQYILYRIIVNEFEMLVDIQYTCVEAIDFL